MYQHRRTHNAKWLEKLLLPAPKCVRRTAVFICQAHMSSRHSLLPRTCNELSVGVEHRFLPLVTCRNTWFYGITPTSPPPPPTTHQAYVSRKSWIACCGSWVGTRQTPVLECFMKWLSNQCSALCNGAVQRRLRYKPEVKNNKETTWRTTLPSDIGLCFLSCCCWPDKGHWLSQSLACTHFLLFDQSWLHHAASGCSVCFQPSKAVSSTLSCLFPLKAIDSNQDSGYPRLVIEARALLQSRQ